MDDTIDTSLVFAKTPKGVSEINARSGALTLQARRVLIMIDGRRPVAELMAVVRSGEFDGIIATLETQGMIEKIDIDPSSHPPRNLEEEDFADTISLLQENAAALRSLPHVNPATLQQAQPQPRPAPAAAEPATEPSADAAAIAARAVATASAPRPVEPAAVRRPPTLSATSGMVAGTARPATMNVVMRSAEPPVRRPATLTGTRPVPVGEQPAVVDARSAPVEKPAAKTEAGGTPATAQAAPPSPAPAPRSLEEEKRLAVSELYAQLGPYGEQAAAKLQECTTIEALREQIKNAGRRVATFRGEKVAQDYLKSVGYP